MLIELKGWKKLTNNKTLSDLNNKLIKIKKGINKSSNEFSFLRSDNNKEIFSNLKKYKKKFKKIDSFLLIGTGGSSLGAKAIISLYDKKKINFIENLDPSTLKNFFKNNKKNSLGLLLISKSGETLEVLCLFDILINSFKNNFDLINNTLIISDKKNSTLRNIANKYSIDVLDHDKTIGGRFSCFSLTGLLPMYLAGINSIKLKELVDNSFKKDLLSKNNVNNIFITAVSQIIRKKEITGHIFLVYSDRLMNVGDWYKQLWNESLGKNGQGLYLISALGAVDQHSQLQMWLDGPKNLIFTIVIPKKRTYDFRVKNKKNILPAYLNNKKMGDLLNIMADSTAAELRKAGAHVRKIYIENDKEESVIKLMTLFILEVSLIGKLIGINPFDQPAVEKVKFRIKKNLKQNAKNKFITT
jgi:glucose-6-phosphate isomerase